MLVTSSMGSGESSVDISVVIPVKNGGFLFRLCLESLLTQDFTGSWEVSIYDDGSTDDTPGIVEYFVPRFKLLGVNVVYGRGEWSGGVGFAKNRAVQASSGKFICFCDADDTSSPNRLQEQCSAAMKVLSETENELLFLGSRFTRDPSSSTERYTKWANSLTVDQLSLQIYTSHGPTLIAPTWFMSRVLYDQLSGFHEESKGYPEDLELFYRAIDLGCILHKVDLPLMVYRYHPGCASFSVSENIIWEMRMDRLRRLILPAWKTFTIWNAGKQGKKFFKCLSEEEQQKVVAFCDVDSKKIGRRILEVFDEKQRRVTHKIPIIHVKNAVPPVCVCVKLDMSDGDLETLIAGSGWTEGIDYILFS